jgi:hypothetical protein
VRVLRREQETAEALEIGMCEDGFDHKAADAMPAVFGKNEYIGQIREGRPISDCAGKANLPSLGKDADAKRIPDAFFDHASRDIPCPIRGAEKLVD